MKKILCVLIWSFCASLSAFAQAPVTTLPYGVTSANASTTVATTNTFQSVWAANALRAGCTLQNKGSATLYVFFGAIASALTTSSVQLTTGQAVSCNAGGTVLRDQVSVTGTSGGAFFAAQQ